MLTIEQKLARNEAERKRLMAKKNSLEKLTEYLNTNAKDFIQFKAFRFEKVKNFHFWNANINN